MTLFRALCILSMLPALNSHFAFSQQISNTELETELRQLEATQNRLETELRNVQDKMKALKVKLAEKSSGTSFTGKFLIKTWAFGYKEASESSPRIKSLNKGDEIKVLEILQDQGFYRISYGDGVGYVLQSNISTPEETAAANKQNEEAAEWLRQREISIEKQRLEQAKTTAEEAERERQREALKRATQEKARIVREARVKKAKIEREAWLKKKYGEAVAARLLAGEIWLGMSKDLVTESIGKPNSINRTIVPGRVHEQWVYSGRRYLYFEDETLTSYQD